MTASLVERTLDRTRKAFLRTWGSPEVSQTARQLAMRNYRYLRLWELYDGSAFSDKRAWQQYKSNYGLYRQIRQVWDHAHEIVEFYATHIWSGSLAKDGLNLPDGIPNAVPLAEDTDPGLAAAIAQLFIWWNFQQQMTVIPRYTAAVSELLVEIHDDPARGKILIELVWPGYVKDVHLDESGNLIYYCIEYGYTDKTDGRHYVYKREVDKEWISTYRDDEPYNYERSPIPEGVDPDGPIEGLGYDFSDQGYPAAEAEDGYRVPNPYGFVPAVWFRHHRVMGVRGEPAIWSTQAQMDEINSLFSHLLDKAHVSLEAPIVVAGNINPRRFQNALENMFGAVKRTFTADDEENGDSETLNILEGPAGTSISTIELKISEAGEAVDRIIKAIEKKCPEVTFYSDLRTMTQVTGPGASRLLGDVDRKVRMIAAGYDHELIKLIQMAVAIAGWRLSEGKEGWATPTTAQKKFAGFDLESYAKGDLDFDIMPRELVPATPKDRYELLQMKKLVLPFLPPEQLAKEGGYSEQQAKAWADQYEKEQLKKQQQAMEMAQSAPFGQGPPKQNGNGGSNGNNQQQTIRFKRPVGAPAGGPQRGAPTQNRRPNSDNPRRD